MQHQRRRKQARIRQKPTKKQWEFEAYRVDMDLTQTSVLRGLNFICRAGKLTIGGAKKKESFSADFIQPNLYDKSQLICDLQCFRRENHAILSNAKRPSLKQNK